MTARRSNTANAYEGVLTVLMGATDLTAVVDTTTGGPATPCYLVIDPGNALKREYVYFDGTFTGTTLVTTLLGNRYLSGSAAGSGLTHAVGAKVRCATTSELIADIFDYVDAHTADTTAAHAASAVSYAGGTGMSATDVEAAIDELATEKQDISALTESVQDIVGALVAAAGGSYNDGAGTIALPATALTEQYLAAAAMGALIGAPVYVGTTVSEWGGWPLSHGTTQSVGTTMLIPTGWATVDIDLWWTNAGAGSGNVRWNVATQVKGDTETVSAGTDHLQTIAAPAQNVLKKSTVVTGLTVTAGKLLTLDLIRLGADGADTLANDVSVIGLNVRKAS